MALKKTRLAWLLLIAGVAFLWQASGLVAVGAVVDKTVDSHAGPWDWANGGLNTAFQYGIQDNISPVLVGASDGFNFAPGDALTITYLSGLTNPFGGGTLFDANGDTAYFANDNPGSSGQPFPSFFMDPATYPIFLNELVGTFSDGSGSIIGTPFLLGNGPTTVDVPLGATYLQLGVNDDVFDDNTGSLLVEVTGPGTAAVPEPSTLIVWLLLGGLGIGIGWRRRWQTV